MPYFTRPPVLTSQAGYDSQPGSTSVWRIRMYEGRTAQIALADGVGLKVTSNNGSVVPNDPSVFKELASSGGKRIFEIYGLSSETSSRPGHAMIEARSSAGSVVAYFQVEVSSIGGKRAFFELEAPQIAVNMSDSPVIYDMKSDIKATYAMSAQDIINKIKSYGGPYHLVFSCHGTADPSKGGPKLECGSGFTWSNIDLWRQLYPSVIHCIWFGSCSIAGTTDGVEFCKAIAKRTGCYVIAPGITLPPVKVAKNQIEVFTRSMPHYFNREGDSMSPTQFFLLQPKLRFKMVQVSS
jgi:hypothetical protein